MVFESLVAGLLNKFLGDYVQNFDSSKLKLGLWGGDVTLKHLDIKESALDDLDLPVKVVSGHLGELILKIPYKNMYTAPVTATIEGLYVLVIPNLGIKYNAEKEAAAAEAAKLAELHRIEEAKRKETAKKDAPEAKQDTFTEKLITQIIKNLQVKITDVHIRYEDNFSDPKNPFSVGFTLHNLSFETTNDKWKPAFVDESVTIIHKLVTLDSLAVYWNSKSEQCSVLDLAARQNAMSRIIATSEYKPENVSYLLGPINSTAQLRLNSKPESDGYKIPKVWLNVIMEEIAVGLSRLQYQDLVKLLESFDRMTVASLYRKYRPDVPHAGHAKEWWKFAMNAILEEDVRRKCRNWSWTHMKQHLSRCKEYKQFYVIKLLGKKCTSDVESKICKCEKELDLFNITVVRRQAELEVLRTPKQREPHVSWGGWVSSFFTATAEAEESAGKKIVKQFEEAMTAEEKEKLYEAIGYQDQPTITEYPKEFVENNLLFLLHNLTLILSDDTKSQTQVLKANLMEVSACVEQRPAAQALSFDAKIDSFVVNGVPTEKDTTPTIVTSYQSVKRRLPLLSILFETNPLDGSCDQRLHLNAQPLQITYDAVTVNNLADVFQPPEKVSFQQLQATAKLKFEDIKEMSAFGLQYAIEQHKYMDLKIDMQPAYIIIPEKGVFETDSQLLVISLGNFKMDTMRRDATSPTIKNMVKAGSSDVEVLSTMIDKAYDKFHIEIQNTEILLVAPEEDWKSAIGVKDDTMHLLKPLTVTVDFHKSIVTVDPRMPKMRLVGELPSLELGVSDFQLTKLLNHLMSIPLPETETVSEPEHILEFSPVLATDMVNVKVVNQMKRAAVHTFSSSESEEETASDGVVQQTTDFVLQFEIKQFGFSLFQRKDGRDQESLKFAFNHFGVDIIMRTFDMTADVYLRGILLEDLQHKTCRGEVLKIISTVINESEEYLFSVKYVAADKKGPDFDSIHNSTLQSITANFNKIDVVLHQESILSIMDLANDLVSNLETTSSDPSASSEEATKKKSQSELKSATKSHSIAKKKKKEYQIIDTRINAGLESFRLVICNRKYDVADVHIKGMNASLIMQKTKTSVTASLKDLNVFNPTPDALYTKILSTVAGEVLDLKVTMYDDATDDENYVDMSAVDMSINVGFGRMKIVYLNKFVSSLLYFLDHFEAAKDKVAEAGAVAAEAAKQSMEEVYEKSSRILLDIIIQAPIIIVPQNSKSTNAIIADLGISKISNRFELGGRRNELGMPAIFERMTLDLQNLQLCRAIVNPKEVALESESLVLEPVSFTLQVTRNHSSGWLRDIPEMEVEGKLDAVKITLSNEDYSTVMSLLSENLTEVLGGEEPPTAAPPVTSTGTAVSKKPSASHASMKTTNALDVKHHTHKVVTRFKFDFILDSVRVTLCSSEKDDENSEIRKIMSMAEVEIRTLKTRARMMSDSSMTAKVVLVDFILDDTRATRKKGITRLLERSVKEGADSMICVEFQQATDGEMKLQTTVSSFSLIFCLDYITKLGEFFASTETPSTQVTDQAIASKPTITPTSTSSDSLSPSSSATVINLKVKKPYIVLIENIEDINSNAIFLHNKIDLVLTLYGNSQVISGSIKNLTCYTACFNPETREGTMSKILVPCDIDVLCNFREYSQHMDIIFKDLIFRISPETVQILSNILASVFSGPPEDQDKIIKETALDYTDLWERKPLGHTKFWFLDTVTGTDVIEELDETGSLSLEPALQPIHQQMLLTMRKIVITIEAGVGNRTVPMLLMESSFQSDVRDWSGNMYIGSSFSLEISYYNEGLSVWEPLMEPIETKNGHRSWELMMEVFQENESLELTPEDEEPEEIVFEPPQMSIQIAAQDILELTFSKTCLDVLTNLGEAFQEAINTKTSEKISQPSSPYHVTNHLGLPITIILSNQSFQILNDDNKYNSVKLESGCPPLQLVYSSLSIDTSTRLSVLKRQDAKEETYFNIKIIESDMNVERKISVASTDKRYFQLPRVTYPGNRWGFVITVLSLYGTRFVTFHSILQVKNNFTVPMDVYYMKDTLNEVEWCACIEPLKSEYVPLHAVYTSTSELFFKPKNLPPSYTLSLPPFVWKDLIDDPSIQKVLRCKDKLSVDFPFYFSVAGEAERIFYEDTNRKTMASSIYKIILNPTAVLRNLLLYPINYSVQGIDKDYLLYEGESHELWGVELDKTAIEIRLSNYLDRDWICYRVVKRDFDELSVWIFEATTGEQKFYLELGMHSVKSKGSIVMELYSPFCMINKTDMNLTYRRSKKYEKFEGKNRKGEDDNIIHHPSTLNKPVLFSFKAKVFFAKKKASLKIADSEWSDKFSLDAVGSTGTLLAKTKHGQTYCIGVEIKLSQSGLTKMVIFTPYYVIVNNCEYDIEIMEAAEGVDWIKVTHCVELSGESTENVLAVNCIPFWPKDANNAKMVVRYYGENDESSVFSFKEVHNTLLTLRSKMGGIHVDCQVAEASVIITFEDYKPGQAAALLVNHTKWFTFKFHQSQCFKEIELNPKSYILYSWENPLEKRALQWKCENDVGEHDLVKDGIGEVIPKSDIKTYWVSFLDGMQRVLLFTDDLAMATAAQEAGELERIEQEITVSLQGVGLSLVNNEAKSEIMYLGITSTGIVWEGRKKRSKRFKPLNAKDNDIIENAFQRYQNEVKVHKLTKSSVLLDGKLEIDFESMTMSRPLVRHLRRTFQTGLWLRYKTSPHQLQLHAKINRLQIDNQLTDCVFPVVLTPVAPPKSVAAANAPKPFTELSIMLRKAEHSAVPQFKYCKILIQEFHIRLDQGFINSLLMFFTADQAPDVDYVKILALDKKIAMSTLKDLAAIYSSQEQKNFFDDLHFSPLKIHISFSMTGGSHDDSKPTPIRSDFVNLLLQSVGVTLTEIQDVVFKLDYFERKYVFMSQKQLIAEVTSHYVGQSVKQLYMLVLGLDVIGNPVGLLLGLGEGVTDLFYEPFQGAIQGPEEFAEGLALGVKSLFGHAIGGAAGAASRITGTLGKGIAALTLDKDYQKRRRQNITRRPVDFTHGIAQSGKGLVMGVFDGVTGIVTKPIEGAREEGVGGFFKGVGKGLIGVVTRPTAGLVDFASGSLDAVKRATQVSEDVKRLRVPRFIKPDGVIRPFVKREAEGNRVLQEVEKGKYANTDTYLVHVPVGDDDRLFLLVTNNRIMYVEKGELFGQWNTVWEYRFEEIKGFPTVTDKGLKIMLQNPQKKSLFGSKVAGKIVHIKDPQLCQWIADKISEVIKRTT